MEGFINCGCENFISLVIVTLFNYLLASTEVIKEKVQWSNVSQSVENRLQIPEWFTEYVSLY